MKTITIAILILILNSCTKSKQNNIQPLNSNNNNQSNSCNQFGACAEGWYTTLPTHGSNFDTTIYESNTANYANCKITFLKYQKRPNYIPNSPDTLKYTFTNFNFNTNILHTDTLYTFIYGNYNDQRFIYKALKLKSGKYVELKFLHY
jgi:hypothetical protein